MIVLVNSGVVFVVNDALIALQAPCHTSAAVVGDHEVLLLAMTVTM
jgi:hypothetical protein